MRFGSAGANINASYTGARADALRQWQAQKRAFAALLWPIHPGQRVCPPEIRKVWRATEDRSLVHQASQQAEANVAARVHPARPFGRPSTGSSGRCRGTVIACGKKAVLGFRTQAVLVGASRDFMVATASSLLGPMVPGGPAKFPRRTTLRTALANTLLEALSGLCRHA